MQPNNQNQNQLKPDTNAPDKGNLSDLSRADDYRKGMKNISSKRIRSKGRNEAKSAGMRDDSRLPQGIKASKEASKQRVDHGRIDAY